MADRLTVTPDERKRFTTGENPSPPKYTYYALNNAVSYSKANHRPTVGDLNDIYNDFRKESPDGDFEDFRNYYFREHNGRRRIEEATEKAYSKFLIIREAIEQIDRDDMREFIEGIVLHGTYSGQSAREAVVEKVVRSLSDCERLDPNEGPDECQIQFGEYFVSVQHESDRDEGRFDDRDDVLVFYYVENDSDSGLQVDFSSVNTSLDDF